ncbi:hypothetical protein ILUMI_03236 [Ignelater luminosus]|uniref:Carbonic anhydrase n=1 Tax=Ignelater luminosus TaxID=2038154 RepID=A0A8K0DF14_IGNLU|nr:hypothetical protein ILUMI_03236 [Ignelater luminosus]
MYLVNESETLRLYIQAKNSLHFGGGVLECPYNFDHLHFHWGTEDDKGSEHKIDGLSYPLEMHVVHGIAEYRTTLDNIVVVSYFFQIDNKTTEGLKNLLEVTEAAAQNRHVKQNVKPFPLSSLVPNSSFSYYSYKGSLTMQPYSETVTWIISNTVLSITPIDMEIFRKAARIDEELENNFRECQELNNRTVYFIQPV